jgi:hypothetical protein
MRITERRLRRLIRSVIKETVSDYRLSVDFSQKVESMIDEVKPGFIKNCRMLRIFDESDLDDYKVSDFLRKYLGEVIHLMGEETAKRRFAGNYHSVTQDFKRYLGM